MLLISNPGASRAVIRLRSVVAALCTAAFGTLVLAQTAPASPTISGAWVRASVPGQRATGAFMAITAPAGAQLVRVQTPVAGVAEVHEMKMEGDVMRMRAVPALELPAGRRVELKPGGYHIMLMDLKQPLRSPAVVPLTLVFKDAKGAESRVEVQAPVALSAPGATAPGAGHGSHGAGHGAQGEHGGHRP